MPADIIVVLENAGFSGLTTTDLYRDPMAGLNDLTSGVTNQQLKLLQASIAVEAYMEITGNFQPSLSDITNTSRGPILNSMTTSTQEHLRATQFSAVSAEVNNALAGVPPLAEPLALGDLIEAVTQEKQTIIALAQTDIATDGTFDPSLAKEAVVKGKIRAALETSGNPMTHPLVALQWNLFCIVHNLKKVARYGPSFA